MRLSALVTLALFTSGIIMPANACSAFNLVAQPVEADGYDPNNQSPIAMQIELYLLDGPAEQSCANHIIELKSQTTQGVRELSNGASVITGATPAGSSVFESYANTTVRLSPQAVNQLVATGHLVFDYAWVEAGTYYPAGLYTNVLDVEVNGFQVATVEPELTVFPAMRLLGDVSSGYGQIDFGTLASNKEILTNFIYQSNAKLTLTAYSQNHGVLVHEDGASIYTIPYSAFINNDPLTTDGVQALELNSTPGAHSIGSIRLRLGDIGVPVAGEYADILTLSFTTD
jgi:hypothetical protein